MTRIPKIKTVRTLKDAHLLVTFESGTEKIYDCSILFSIPQFHLLASPAFFNAVHVDPGGYGISWSDDIDLSEYELWTNGKPVADTKVGSDHLRRFPTSHSTRQAG